MEPWSRLIFSSHQALLECCWTQEVDVCSPQKQWVQLRWFSVASQTTCNLQERGCDINHHAGIFWTQDLSRVKRWKVLGFIRHCPCRVLDAFYMHEAKRNCEEEVPTSKGRSLWVHPENLKRFWWAFSDHFLQWCVVLTDEITNLWKRRGRRRRRWWWRWWWFLIGFSDNPRRW